jgi:hypothetical protein
MYVQHNGGGGLRPMIELYGKGMFLWKVKNLYGGDPSKIDPLNIVARAKKLKLDWVTVKIANGRYRYNLRPPTWTDDILPSMTKALQLAGIPVWGWHYVYGDDPYGEAEIAIKRINDLGMDGYIIDAEKQYKNKPHSAKVFMGEIVKGILQPIGLASYRYPSLHPELPWKEFLQGCDYHMPQFYWAESTNVIEQWERCKKELTALADLPFAPIGPAYQEHGWMPRPQDMTLFFDTVLAEGHPGISWWSWDQLQLHQLMKQTVKAMVWEEEVPEPPPPDDDDDDLVAIKKSTDEIRALTNTIDRHAENGLGTS